MGRDFFSSDKHLSGNGFQSLSGRGVDDLPYYPSTKFACIVLYSQMVAGTSNLCSGDLLFSMWLIKRV
jgi:hypothetical protein